MENTNNAVLWAVIISKILTIILKIISKIGIGIIRIFAHLLNGILLFISNILEDKLLGKWEWWSNKYEEDEEEEEMYQIQIVSNGTKHEYIMNRGKEYDKLYEGFLGKIEVTTKGNTIVLDEKLSKDIIDKVDRMVFLVEKNAIREGYRFGRNSRSDIDEEEIYNEYITEQVRKGM